MGTDPLGIIVLEIVMKKKYKCRLSASSLLVNINAKVIRIEFEPDVISKHGLRGCSFKTENEDMQHAIEHSKRFAKVTEDNLSEASMDAIWTDDIEAVKEEPKIEAEAPVVETKKVVRRGKAKKEE